jgi:putative transposase
VADFQRVLPHDDTFDEQVQETLLLGQGCLLQPAAQEVFAQVRGRDFPRLEIVYGDNKSHNYELYEWLAQHRRPYGLYIVRRSADQDGFEPLPKRWVVERTFAWLGRYRRLSKDYEPTTASSEAMVHIAAIHHLLRRLAPQKLSHSQRFRFQRPTKQAA